jgi:hypothetical protein
LITFLTFVCLKLTCNLCWPISQHSMTAHNHPTAYVLYTVDKSITFKGGSWGLRLSEWKMILNVRWPCTRKHGCTEKVILWINFMVLLEMWKELNIIKHAMYEIRVTFLLEVTSLYASSLVLLCSRFLSSVLASVSSQFTSSVLHSLLKPSCLQTVFQVSLQSSHPSISSHIQHSLNPLSFISGDICCHDLDLLAQWFYTGHLYCPNGVRAWMKECIGGRGRLTLALWPWMIFCASPSISTLQQSYISNEV